MIVALILLLGLVDALAGRRSYGAADSVSYMDMASQIAQGHLDAAINALWSPLYPLILSAFIRPALHDSAAEFAIVRGVNFVIFIATLLAFAIFLRRFQAMLPQAGGDSNSAMRPSPSLSLSAWLLFAWGCLSLDMASRVSPDMLVIALFFLASAQLLNFQAGRTAPAQFILFGLILGLGYWTKAIYIPLAALFLAAAFSLDAVRRCKKRFLWSIAVFLLIAAPLVAGYSGKYHRFNFGMSGMLNYAWHVNGVEHWTHWQGGPQGSGTPLHPTLRIYTHPDAFAFPFNAACSYAPWYDPAYWYAGVTTHCSISQQLHALGVSLHALSGVLRHSPVFLVVLCAVLLIVLRPRFLPGLFAFHARTAPLWFIALGTVAIYVCVHVEARYLAAPLAVAALLLMTPLFLAESHPRWLPPLLATALLVALLAEIGPRLTSAAELLVNTRGNVQDSTWKIQNEFARLGVSEGTPVAGIGDSFTSDWARLAHLRVIAEIPYQRNERLNPDIAVYWTSPPAAQQAVLEAFRTAGARYVVANHVPDKANTSQWVRIPQSRFYYRALASTAAADRGNQQPSSRFPSGQE